MIDLKDLEYVNAISKAGGVKKAADATGITQPALTRRIKKLEQRLQLRLFDRQAKGMRLTQAGELFLQESHKLLAHTRDFEARLSNHSLGKGGNISIGIKPGLDDAFFRKSLVEFTTKYPETSFQISIDATPVLSEKLKNGTIDFAVGATGYADNHGNELVLSDELEFQPLFSIPLELFVRKGHPVLLEKNIPQALFNYPLVCPTPPYAILQMLGAEYEKTGSKYIVPHFQVDDFRQAADLAERTDMWSVIFASSHIRLAHKDKFVFLGSSPLLPPLEIGLLKRKTWSITPWANNLIEIMKKHASEWAI